MHRASPHEYLDTYIHTVHSHPHSLIYLFTVCVSYIRSYRLPSSGSCPLPALTHTPPRGAILRCKPLREATVICTGRTEPERRNHNRGRGPYNSDRGSTRKANRKCNQCESELLVLALLPGNLLVRTDGWIIRFVSATRF